MWSKIPELVLKKDSKPFDNLTVEFLDARTINTMISPQTSTSAKVPASIFKDVEIRKK